MSKSNSVPSKLGVNWNLFSVSPKQFGKAAAIGLGAVAAVLMLVLPRISEVLPKILADELLYSQNARLLSPGEWFLPNYLFNWVFSATNMCGYGFYSCGKAINAVLLLLLGFVVYASARLLLRPSISLLISFLISVGPIAVYASYFTPDTMFYLAMSIVIFIAMQLNQSSLWWHWLALGGMLAIASIIKPHALFAIPALIAFCLFLAVGTEQKKILIAVRNIFILLTSTLSLKFAFGFALAGTNGLTLFGSYGNALESATAAVSQAQTPENLQESAPAESTVLPNATSETVTFTLESFGAMAAWEIILHIGFLVIAYSLPLIIASRTISNSISAKDTNRTSSKLAFLAVSTLFMGVLSTAVFTAFAPSWGEILDYRLMVRYYEYALPALVITVLIPNESTEKFSKSRLVIIALAIIVSAVATTRLTTVVPPLYTDSTLFSGLYFSNISIWIFTAISAALLLYSLKNQEKAARYWLFGWLPAVTLIVAISTQLAMTGPSSVKGMYTIAAQTAHSVLTQEQRDQLIVVGNFKNNVQAAQLWIDSKSVQGLWIDRGQNLDVDAISAEVKYVLVIGEMNISGSFEIIEKDESFAILKLL
jgi:phosphoglycerol transferase